MKKINLFKRNANLPSYRRMPVSSGFNRGGGIPAFAGMTKKIYGMTAVIFALFVATPSFAAPTELDKKTVASKAYVDTKQDKITTGLVELYSAPDADTYNVPSLVSYGTGTNNADGLLGNKIGIVGFEHIRTDLHHLSYDGMDNYVPTVRAVASAITRLSWSSAQSTAINAYNTTFGNATNQWAGDGYHLIDGDFLADSLALKQNKLPAKSTGNAAPKGNQAIVLNTAGNPSNVYTTAGKDLALTARSGAQKVMNYIDGTTASATFATSQGLTEAKVKSALVSLELLKDVYSELNAKITNNALPTGTTGTVVTYNGTNATTGVQEFGERAVYDPANAYNAQNDATKLATMASVKYECAGYEAGHENDPDYCWLWALPN